MTKDAEGLIDIGRLILRFAEVNRVTYHEDGVTPESDTDHTMMLSICACALAEKLYTGTLDIGLVAQFAIVHDLVEAYAEDTDSFGLNEDGRKEKEEREEAAFLRIEREFKDVYPWLPEMIKRYNALDTREARFVKTTDKLMTRITHVLNSGAMFKAKGYDRDEMWKLYEMTLVADVRYADEFPEIVELMDETIKEADRRTYGTK